MISQTQINLLPHPQPSRELGPANDRLMVIDAIRGLAIFGILIINMAYFAWPKMRNWGIYPIHFANHLDMAVELVARFVAKGKFYTIFSFLFGLGMAMQYDRFQARGKPFSLFFLGRMLILAGIGAIHGFLIWHGDILLIYAVLGLLLIPFQRARPGILLSVAAVIFLYQLYFYLGFVIESTAQAAQPGGLSEMLARWVQGEAHITALYNATLEIYTTGSWTDVLVLRSSEFVELLESLPYWGPDLFLSYLLGAWAWRKGVFTNIKAHQNLLKRVLLWGGLIGVFTNGYTVLVYFYRVIGPEQQLAYLCWFVGKFALGYAILAALLLLWERGVMRRCFAALAPVGRMALSNYLLHSVVFTLIFNGYGLGLMGQFGEFTVFLMAAAMFAIQIPMSAWVLNNYHFGPVEWAWRKLSYLNITPQKGSGSR